MPIPLLISRDATLIEVVQAAGAAVQVNPVVARDTQTLRQHWANASLILVGADQAATVAGLGLPARDGVHLCGPKADELLAWSVPLGAPALVLPEQSGYLSSLLSGRDGPRDNDATVVRLVGGSGGVGATTLATALAQRAAAKRGVKVALVELDDSGGGIDLLFGAEQLPGWRWPDLASAAGHVGDLSGQLPRVDDVDLVSLGRLRQQDSGPQTTGRTTGGLPRPEAVQAVLAALKRSHELLVLDAGSHPDPVTSNRGTTLLCVAADVKAVLAARSKVERQGLTDALAVVRAGPGRRLDAQLVGETLGLPVCAVVPHDPRIPIAQEAGESPGRGRRRYRRACDQILDEVCQP